MREEEPRIPSDISIDFTTLTDESLAQQLLLSLLMNTQFVQLGIAGFHPFDTDLSYFS